MEGRIGTKCGSFTSRGLVDTGAIIYPQQYHRPFPRLVRVSRSQGEAADFVDYFPGT